MVCGLSSGWGEGVGTQAEFPLSVFSDQFLDRGQQREHGANVATTRETSGDLTTPHVDGRL